jgi:hypothetical protein
MFSEPGMVHNMTSRSNGMQKGTYAQCIHFSTKYHVAMLADVVSFFTSHALAQFNNYKLRVTENV